MRAHEMRIPVLLWMRLLTALRRRGGGRSESGAFLLTKAGASRVSRFICYDDLDPMALASGIVVFRGASFVPLWNFCQRNGMRVVADAHTHCGDWTGQSEADRTNPMIGLPGHIALIVPHFAQCRWQTLDGVGIFEYLGDHEWRSWPARSSRVRISLI